MNAVASRNIKFISHCDQGGRGDGVQVMVHRGYAYIGHGYSQRHHRRRRARSEESEDRSTSWPARRTPARIHLQTHGDLLLAVNGPEHVDHAGQ